MYILVLWYNPIGGCWWTTWQQIITGPNNGILGMLSSSTSQLQLLLEPVIWSQLLANLKWQLLCPRQIGRGAQFDAWPVGVREAEKHENPIPLIWNTGGDFLFLHFFWSSRFPFLVFAAKIYHLLHFVAKISHSHCSSNFPLVSRFGSMVFIEFSIVFIGLSMIFFNVSIVQFFHGFLELFYGVLRLFHSVLPFFNGFLQFFYVVFSISAWFSFSFHLFSLIVPEFSLICTWFSLFLEIHDVQTRNCRCKKVYTHD